MTKRDPATLSSQNIVEFLEDIFLRRGNEEYLGEPVTMAQHMLQGAHFAEEANEPEEIVVSALLHDIGHFTSEFGMFSMQDTEDKYHEEAGAELLGKFFPDIVTDCVRYHVAAKRYLCATDQDYFAKLSSASVHSLNLQGGPMNREEVAEFEKNPNLKAIVRVRIYDDKGKVADFNPQPFSHYREIVQRVVDRHINEKIH
ncbi:MAG: (R)-1-hydroxy-2-trimethylaminoethylphosphonate oxygenase [Rhizobiaceae bacterium]